MKIQDRRLELPILQGGMGVGVSLSKLAGAVAKEGAMGVISAAHPGYNDPNFRKDPLQTNLKALKYHIQKAKEIADGHGLIGVNLMVAMQHYDLFVEACIEAKCDAIISGAGLPLDLPKYAKGKCLIAPIVSSGKAIKVICKMWDKKYQFTPDFVVIEGPLAGGHLGFKKEEMINQSYANLDEILVDVLAELKEFQEKYQKEIPVFVAGGIQSNEERIHYMNLGASGIQIATPFIPTFECDASQEFKDMIINARQEDIGIVVSPAGMPGRAIYNSFIKKQMETGNICMKNCLHCMKPCTPENTPYCISEALIQSVKGNCNHGLVFTSVQAARLNEMKYVKDVINEYMGVEE